MFAKKKEREIIRNISVTLLCQEQNPLCIYFYFQRALLFIKRFLYLKNYNQSMLKKGVIIRNKILQL